MLILLVIFAMLRPGVVWSQFKSQRATMAVMLDFSASQQLPSDTSGLSRWKKQQEIWEEFHRSLKHHLKIWIWWFMVTMRSLGRFRRLPAES